MAPATSSQRKCRLPCFEILPSLSLPPVAKKSPVLGGGGQSAPRIEASENGAPATCVGVVLLQLVKSFAMGRTKANVNPPPPVPQITGADT
jgi:hypothetical protein